MSNKAWDAGQRGSTGGEHVGELLSPYIDNDLDAEARAQVRKHLHECADCRADYVELQATRKILGSLPTVVPPRAFTITPEMAEVHNPRLARIAGGQRGFWERVFSPRNAPRFAFGSVVSVVLTLVVLAGGLLSAPNEQAAAVVALQAPVAGSAPSSDSFKSSPANAATAYAYEDQGPPAAGALPPEQTPSTLAAQASTPVPSNSAPGAGAAGAGSAGGAGGGIAAEATSTTAAAAGIPATPALGAAESSTGAVAPTSTTAPSMGTTSSIEPTANSAQDSSVSGLLASPTTTTLGGRSSLSPPEPVQPSSSPSPFDSTGGGLLLSVGVLFGLLSILLATAALVSTRRSR